MSPLHRAFWVMWLLFLEKTKLWPLDNNRTFASMSFSPAFSLTKLPRRFRIMLASELITYRGKMGGGFTCLASRAVLFVSYFIELVGSLQFELCLRKKWAPEIWLISALLSPNHQVVNVFMLQATLIVYSLWLFIPPWQPVLWLVY